MITLQYVWCKWLAFGCILLILYSCNHTDEYTVPTVSSKDSTEVFRLKSLADSLSQSRPDSAFYLYQHSLNLSRSIHFERGIVQNLIRLGVLSTDKGNYGEALSYINEGLQYVRSGKETDSSILEVLYNGLAAIYLYTGHYDEAAQYSYKANIIATNQKRFNAIARNVNNLGSVLSGMGEMEKALDYIERGKEVAYKHKVARDNLSYLYLNEASILYELKNYDYALSKCQSGLQVATEFRQVSVQYDAIYLSGRIYEDKGNLSKAYECYLKVLHMDLDYPAGKMRAAMSMGALQIKMGAYPLAKEYLIMALRTARELNARRELVDIYKYLVQYYRKAGDYDQAFAHQEQATALKDSMLNLEKINAVNLMEVKYNIAQKDREIAENKLMITSQKAKIVRNNILVWGILLIASAIIILFRINYRNRQRSEEQRKKIAVWQALSEGEEKERTRIARELHDGIGGLMSTLRMQLGILAKRMPGVATIDIYHESRNLLDNIIAEIRKTAHNLMPELILRHGLVEAIRIFCNNVRDDEDLKMDFQYYGYIGNLNPGFQLAAYRIIQELLQNVLKHACAGKVLVQLSRHNDVLDITVEDNGKGFNPAEERNGMGLNSIERRVKELDGNMHIQSTLGKGTNIYIEFNLSGEQLSGKEQNSGKPPRQIN